MRVVVLGGAGVFGSFLAQLLVRDGHELWIAGRDLDKARAAAARIGGRPLQVDRRGDLSPLVSVGPEVVVDAAGPFQDYGRSDSDLASGTDPYRVARLCFDKGVDYLDLSDDAGFTAGIAVLNDAALAAGRRVLSGASSVPGLSSAALAALAQGLDDLCLIEAAILPGNKAPRGRSVMASILGQIGRPMRVWRGGAWHSQRGWSGRLVYRLGPGGQRRAGYFIPVPDLYLFPDAFKARSVLFRAGMELGVMNAGLVLLGALRRVARLPVTPRRLGLVHGLARWLAPFGTDRGFMLARVVGSVGGRVVERRWQLTATDGDGPFVPAVVVRALLRNLDTVPPGARPCLAEMPLADLEAAMADLSITTAITETERPPLFQTVLQDRWAALQPTVRRLHGVQDVERFSGTASVERGRSWIARLAAWVFGFPPAAAAVPVTVTKSRIETGKDGETAEIWQRDFGGRVFRSRCGAAKAPYRFRERFGLFTFELDLPVTDGALSMPVRRGWLLGVPLPRLLLPTSDAREYEADGVFHFDVALGAPLGGGLIVRYRGTLTPDTP